MQNVTGCKINVSQPSGRDIEREIGLIGSRSAIEHAKHVIHEKVRAVEDKNGATTKPSNNRNPNDIPYNTSASTGAANYGQNYNYAQQQGYQAPSAIPAAAAAPAAGGADPYAAYGGYENYMAMWDAYLRTQGQAGAGAPTS